MYLYLQNMVAEAVADLMDPAVQEEDWDGKITFPLSQEDHIQFK